MAKKERQPMTTAQFDSLVLQVMVIGMVLIVLTDWFIYDLDGKGPQGTLFGGVGR